LLKSFIKTSTKISLGKAVRLQELRSFQFVRILKSQQKILFRRTDVTSR